MFRLVCFCLALVSGGVACGQQQASVPVQGGRIVGVFVPDGQQIAPAADPAFQQPAVVQQRHAGNCGCPVCKRTVVGKTKQVFSKTHTTVVTTEHFIDEHPVQFFNEMPRPANPCPPKDPCIRQGTSGIRSSGVLASWDTGFRGYRPQQCPPNQQRGGFFSMGSGRPLLAVSGSARVMDFGPQLNLSIGHAPPYAQAGHNYNGNYAWHGGR